MKKIKTATNIRIIFILIMVCTMLAFLTSCRHILDIEDTHNISGEELFNVSAEELLLYRERAERDDIEAQFMIAVIYLQNRNYEQAIYWYERAAELGDVASQLRLGYLHYRGYGIEQNHEQALYWFRQAAEQNDPAAQHNLGWMYYFGYGTAQSFEQAAYWYRKAAEQGDSYAQNNMGWLYHHGSGVEQSYAQAAYWYGQAIAQGNELARANLALLPAQYRVLSFINTLFFRRADE